MKTSLLYLNRQRRNQHLLFWWRRVSTLLLFHLSFTIISFAQDKAWDRALGGRGTEFLQALQQTSDGGYIIGGYSYSDKGFEKSQNNKGNTNSSDFWIVKLNADGSKAWDKTFGGNSWDELTALQQTADGGYILGGWSLSDKIGDKSEASKGGSDYWLIKLDANGRKVWDKTIGGNSSDGITSIQQTSDGGYILGGTSGSGKSGNKSESSKGDNDYWVVKLNANGNIAWDKTIGGTSDDWLSSIRQTKDGGYILGGSSNSGIGGDKTEPSRSTTSEDYFERSDYWVVKLTAGGRKEWDKTLGGNISDDLTSVWQTSNGNYLLGGTSESEISGDKSEGNEGNDDYWVIMLNAKGNKIWDKTFGGDGYDHLTSLQQTLDGGFILGGYSASGISGDKSESAKGNSDYWIVKLDAEGTKTWDKTFGGNAQDELAMLQQTSEEGYILGGSTMTGKNGDKSQYGRGAYDYWVLKINVKKTQTITFNPIPNKKLVEAPFTLSAKASSNLPVTFSVVSGPATIKGNTITLTGTGEVTVEASQAGNDTYKPATATQTFRVLAPSSVVWDKTYGGTEIDDLAAMAASPDGGYLLGGSSYSGKSGNKSQNGQGEEDYWLVKTDKSGNKLWDKGFGGTGSDNLTSIVTTPDGGYLLGGYSDSGVSGDKSQAGKGKTDYWVIKIDGQGNKLWDKAYGGNSADYLFTIFATTDGNYLLGGASLSDKSGDKSQANKGSYDYWLIKINNTGTKLWDQTYGGSKSDDLAAIVVAPNGGYLLGGSSSSGISGDKSQATRGEEDYWVIRIDEKGTKIWDKTYGGTLDYYISDGCESENEEDCKRYFGGSTLTSLVVTPDGGFLLGGSSSADKGADKSEENQGVDEYDYFLRGYWVVKIDKDGNKIWDNTYTGTSEAHGDGEGWFFITGYSTLKAIVPTNDGHYLLAGSSDADKGIDKSEGGLWEDEEAYERDDYWLIKIDENGQKKWDQVIGGLRMDFLSTILPAADGGYLLGGSSASNIGGDKTEAGWDTNEDYWERSDYWIVKIQDDTPPLTAAWDMRYGGSGNEGFTAIIKTSDGGYLSGGYSPSGVSGDKTQSSQGQNDYWIVKSDQNGKKLWDKRYGGSSDDYLNRIIQTQDGGYLLAGSSLSGVSGDKTQASRGNRDYWIVKTDAQGNKLWDKRYGGTGYDELKKVIQLATGEYILAGYSNSPAGGNKSQPSQGGLDYWIIKISSTGSQLWDKSYGGNLNETLSGIVLTAEGGFLLGGSSLSGKSGSKSEVSRGGSDFWLIQVDKNGNKVWDKTYGGSGEDEAYSLGRSGKDYFISGQSDSPADGDKTRGSQGVLDFWFLKITITGAKVWDKRFGGTGADELRASIQTSDGGYLLAGRSFSNKSGNKSQNSQGGSSDYWIVKTNSEGMYEWDKRFGGNGAEELRAVIQTNEGGYLLAGKSDSGVSGDRTQPSQGGTDYWLVKVTPETKPLVAAREAMELEEPVAPVKEVQVKAYPNPFTDKATISFALPENQKATVRVYDIQGREVATLFQGEVEANKLYEVEWKPSKPATGIYLLQLQTPTTRSQHKLLLTK